MIRIGMLRMLSGVSKDLKKCRNDRPVIGSYRKCIKLSREHASYDGMIEASQRQWILGQRTHALEVGPCHNPAST